MAFEGLRKLMPRLDSYRWGSNRLSAETSNVKGFTDNVLPVQDPKVIISHDSIWHQGPSKGMYHVHCCKKKEVGLDPQKCSIVFNKGIYL